MTGNAADKADTSTQSDSSSSASAKARDVAERLLAGLYYHPDHMALVAAHEPVMPNAALDAVWTAMREAHDGGDLDTARLNALLTSGRDVDGNRLHVNSERATALTGTEANARRLVERIRKHEVLDRLEAATYGHRSDQLEKWSQELSEWAAKERLATRLGALVARIRTSDRSLDHIAAALMEEIQKTTAGAGRSTMRHISEYVDEAIEDTYLWEEGQDLDFIDTGFYSLDRVTGGLPVGELTIFAAPSGAGKTSFVLQLVRQVALIEAGKPNPRAVVFFSIEMTAKQVVHRAAAAWKGVDLRKARTRPKTATTGGVTLPERQREALESLRNLPIYIDPDPEPTLEQIRSRTLQVAAGHEVAVVAVDYDEKVDEPFSGSEEQRVAAISKGLKVIGKDLNAAAVALSQYNSNPSNQIRPGTDDDLRYSRKKKHEAHTILHWYWPAYWIKKGIVDLQHDSAPDGYDPHHENRGYLYCTKNRSGETGRVTFDFEPKYTRFADPNEPREHAPF